MIRVIFFMLISLALVAAQESPVEIQKLVFGGSGCSKGTSMELDTGDEALHFIMEAFRVEVAAPSVTFSRLNCEIVLPLRVKSGYQVALPSIKLNGRNSLGSVTTAKLRVETYFAGQKGWSVEQIYNSNGDFQFIATDPSPKSTWSPCGRDVNLRAKVSVRLQSNGGVSPASTALLKGTILPLRLKKCDET